MAPNQTAAASARALALRDSGRRAKPSRIQQIDEVRSGGGYFSQNDLRIHFGLGKADKVQLLEIRWPSGQVDTLKDVKVNQLVFVKEGEGIVRTMQFPAPPGKRGSRMARSVWRRPLT